MRQRISLAAVCPVTVAGLACVLLWFTAAGCTTKPKLTPNAAAARRVPSPPPPHLGYSGMVSITHRRFLVVHDFKNPGDPPRLGVLSVGDGPVTYEPLDLVDAAGNRPVDLEGVCRIPQEGMATRQRPAEFLATESRRRIWHLRLTGDGRGGLAAQCLGVIPLPQDLGDEVEGIACASRTTVVLGLRGGMEQVQPSGGAPSYTRAKLVWRELDLATHSLRPDTGGEVELVAPRGVHWHTGERRRLCADLLIDEEQILSVATEDPGDAGPFRSIVYRVGTVRSPPRGARPEAIVAVEVYPDPLVLAVLDGLKVEALSEGILRLGDFWPRSSGVTGDTLAHGYRRVYIVATDDEIYGGVWRPLFTEALGPMSRPVATLTTRPATTLPHGPREGGRGD